MPLTGLSLSRLAAPLPLWRGTVDASQWREIAQAVRAAGGRLVSLWGSERGSAAAPLPVICVAYALPDGLSWLELPLSGPAPAYPDLSGLFPGALRLQRATSDLLGFRATGLDDQRPWLNHGAWPTDYRPLSQAARLDPAPPPTPLHDYPFVRVAGDGVHEIAVGPVHAGIIEPGHFRFSVVGEKVLRLEQRLGYVHKGIAQRFSQLPPLEGHRLAGRVSGDSTVAFAWAYCMALEAACQTDIPPRAHWLRALLLERERVANHLGDLGALGNDAALTFGQSQFSRLREDWLRQSQAVFGHRLLMDQVVPGGVASDPSAAQLAGLVEQCRALAGQVHTLAAIYAEHAGLQDRLRGTGRVDAKLARQLGLTGLAGRASGQAFDLRCDQPWTPYDRLAVNQAGETGGDVAARVKLRFTELLEALRLIGAICQQLPDGALRQAVQLPAGAAFGAGWVEGWRGEVLVALELDGPAIGRCHCHDPSWHNWPVLEHAVMGNIVPDFPLINKSFNLSYAGHDL